MPSKGKSRGNRTMAASIMAVPPRELAGELLYPSKKVAASCVAFEDLQVLYQTEGWLPPLDTLRFRLPHPFTKVQRERTRGIITEQLVNCALFDASEALPAIHFLSTPAQSGLQQVQFMDLRIPEQVGDDRRAALIEACNDWKLAPGLPLPQALFLTSEEARSNITPQDIAVRVRRVPAHFMSQSSNFRINFHVFLAPQLAVGDPASGALEPSIVQCMYGIFRSLPQGRKQLTDEVLVHIKTPGKSVARQVAAAWGSVVRFRNDGSMYTFPLSYPGQLCGPDRPCTPMSIPYGVMPQPPPAAGPNTMATNGAMHVNGSSTPIDSTGIVNGVPPPEVKIIEHCPRCGYQKVTPPNGIFNPQILGGQGRAQGRHPQSVPSAPTAQYMPYADMVDSPAAQQDTSEPPLPVSEVQSSPESPLQSHDSQDHAKAARVRDEDEDNDAVSVVSVSSCDLTERNSKKAHVQEVDVECGSPANNDGGGEAAEPSLFVNPLFFKLLQVTATGGKTEGDGGTASIGGDGSLTGSNAALNGLNTTGGGGEHEVKVLHAQLDATTEQLEASSNAIGLALHSAIATQQEQRRKPAPAPLPRKRADSGPETPPLPVPLPAKPLDTFIDEADAKEELEEGKPTTKYYYDASTRNWRTQIELDKAFDWLEREEKLAAIKRSGGKTDILPPSSPLGSDLDEADFRTIVVDRLDDEPRPHIDGLGNVDLGGGSPRTPTAAGGASPSSGTKLARARPKRGRGGGAGGLSLAASAVSGRVTTHGTSSSRREQSPMPHSPVEAQAQPRAAVLYERLLQEAKQAGSSKTSDMGTRGPLDGSDSEGDVGDDDIGDETFDDRPRKEEDAVPALTPAALLFPEMTFSDDEDNEKEDDSVPGGFKSSGPPSESTFEPGHSSQSTELFASSDTRVDDLSSSTVVEVEDDHQPIDKGVLFLPVEEHKPASPAEDDNEDDEDDFVDAQTHLPFASVSPEPVSSFADDEATALAIAVAAAAAEESESTTGPEAHNYDYELALTLSLIEENATPAIPPITTRPPAPYHPDSASGIARGRRFDPGEGVIPDEGQQEQGQDPFYTQSGPMDYDLFE